MLVSFATIDVPRSLFSSTFEVVEPSLRALTTDVLCFLLNVLVVFSCATLGDACVLFLLTFVVVEPLLGI